MVQQMFKLDDKKGPWRKAILRKTAYVSGESGQNLAVIAEGFANIQISWQMGSQKESNDFDEAGESGMYVCM